LDGDVLLAPHHGSLNANTRELAAWSGAEWVVVSGGRNDPSERLRAIYGPRATVFSTAESGAVTVSVAGDGSLRCIPYRAQRAAD
jgi:competence protein ComEC